jgi:hypothetical protein
MGSQEHRLALSYCKGCIIPPHLQLEKQTKQVKQVPVEWWNTEKMQGIWAVREKEAGRCQRSQRS